MGNGRKRTHRGGPRLRLACRAHGWRAVAVALLALARLAPAEHVSTRGALPSGKNVRAAVELLEAINSGADVIRIIRDIDLRPLEAARGPKVGSGEPYMFVRNSTSLIYVRAVAQGRPATLTCGGLRLPALEAGWAAVITRLSLF
jgi:hypothetical protein